MENPVGMTVQQALIKLITEFLLQGPLARGHQPKAKLDDCRSHDTMSSTNLMAFKMEHWREMCR